MRSVFIKKTDFDRANWRETFLIEMKWGFSTNIKYFNAKKKSESIFMFSNPNCLYWHHVGHWWNILQLNSWPMEASKDVVAIFFKNQNITTLSLSYTCFSAYASFAFVVAPSYSSCCRDLLSFLSCPWRWRFWKVYRTVSPNVHLGPGKSRVHRSLLIMSLKKLK